MYYLYILECADNSLYTWITTDISRRIDEHNNSSKWAKYTLARRPVKLVYLANFPDRSSASKEEYRIKKLSKGDKLILLKNF